MAKLLRWDLKRITEMIVLTLLNRYDAVICHDGLRGTGKSTLAVVLARRVSRMFSRLKNFDEETINHYWERVSKQIYPTFEDFVEKIWELKQNKAYVYKIKRDTIYTREAIIKFFNKKNGIAIGDEAIISCFNRSFFDEEQKNLIKIINTNRDFGNFFIACVPAFNTLDTQIRGLIKIRFTVIRRGLALVHTPNKSFYSSDRWDIAYNSKLEAQMLVKKLKNPQYAKFTTVRGMVRFPNLTESVRKVYEEVKEQQRNVIAREQYGIDGKEQKEELTPARIMADKLVNDGVKNKSVIEGYAFANDVGYEILVRRINRELTKQGKNPSLNDYYWDSIRRQKAEGTHVKEVNGISKREGESKLAYQIRTK